MAQNRPSKRARVGGSFHDPIPFADDFSIVHAREGRLVRVGNERLAVPVEHEPQHETDRAWNSAPTWLPADDPQYALDPDGEWYDEVVDRDIMAQDDNLGFAEDSRPTAKKKKHVRSKASVSIAHFDGDIGPHFHQRRPHVMWRDVHRQSYLEEMIRWAGRADFRGADRCPDCAVRRSTVVGQPEYRCRECFIPDLVCQICCVKRHRAHPLHRIEVRIFPFF